MEVELQVCNSTNATARYVTWAPSPCRAKTSSKRIDRRTTKVFPSLDLPIAFDLSRQQWDLPGQVASLLSKALTAARFVGERPPAVKEVSKV